MRVIQTTLLGLSLLSSAPLLALDSNTILENVLDSASRAIIESGLGEHNSPIMAPEHEPIEVEREVIDRDEHGQHSRHQAVHGGPPPWAPAHGYRRKFHDYD